jgi:hypothetical protein
MHKPKRKKMERFALRFKAYFLKKEDSSIAIYMYIYVYIADKEWYQEYSFSFLPLGSTGFKLRAPLLLGRHSAT